MRTKGNRRASNPELRKLMKHVQSVPGWRIERTKSGWKFLAPDGDGIVTIHDGPSDRRAIANIKSNLRQAGMAI